MAHSEKSRSRTWTVAAFALAIVAASCSTQAGTADNTVTATSALSESSDVSHAPKLGGMMGHGPDLGPGLFLGSDDRAFRCDDSPEVTTVEICGATLPSAAHYEWTSCAPPPFADGGMPPPPPGPRGASTGSADIVTTYTQQPDDSCGEGTTLTSERTATFSIERTDPRGRAMKEEGKTIATSTHAPGATDYSETITVDTTRSRLESDGSVLDSMQLTGSITVAIAGAGDSLVRTFSGTTLATFSTGETETVVMTELVRPAPSVCFWPTSGTVERTGKDGTTHTLVFGPDCGTATLDGSAFNLKAGGPRGDGPRRGGPHP